MAMGGSTNFVWVRPYSHNHFFLMLDQQTQHQLEHLVEVYRRTQETPKQLGLRLLHELKHKHIELKSFARM